MSESKVEADAKAGAVEDGGEEEDVMVRRLMAGNKRTSWGGSTRPRRVVLSCCLEFALHPALTAPRKCVNRILSSSSTRSRSRPMGRRSRS